jgi:hypothetical protein
MVGDLPGIGAVWYQEGGMENILSLSKLRSDGYKIHYSSDINKLVVTKKYVTHVFVESGCLYYYDRAQHGEFSLITTVANNQYSYGKRDYSQALLTRRIQRIIGRPSNRKFAHILSNNQLPNCPVTYHDVMAAENIFGPGIGALKGKTVRQTQTPCPYIYESNFDDQIFHISFFLITSLVNMKISYLR